MNEGHRMKMESDSIKAVSSLRSHFENLSTPRQPSTNATLEQPLTNHTRRASQDPSRLLISAQTLATQSTKSTLKTNHTASKPEVLELRNADAVRQPPTPPKPRARTKTPAKSRETSLQPNVTSPNPPLKSVDIQPNRVQLPVASSLAQALRYESHHAASSRPFHTPSRSPSPKKRGSPVHISQVPIKPLEITQPNESSYVSETQGRPEQSRALPQVNRAAKPRIELKNLAHSNGIGDFAHTPTESTILYSSRVATPFNTPPSSRTGTPAQEECPPMLRYSKPMALASSATSVTQFLPPPTHHSITQRRRTEGKLGVTELAGHALHKHSHSGTEEQPPMLPPRREIVAFEMKETEPIPRRSLDTLSRASALSKGFSSSSSARHSAARALNTNIHALSREARELERSLHVPKGARTPPRVYNETNDRLPSNAAIQTNVNDIVVPSSMEFPSSTRTNRRPPHFHDAPRIMPTGHESRLFDVCGEYVCASGSITRVWSVLTGRIVLSLAHGEGIHITAMCFKPTRNVMEEGTRLWLGTNWGDLLELDITAKRIIASNDTSHHRHEVCGIYRHATDIWTLDTEGKLCTWPSADDDAPSLERCNLNTRTGRRPSASIVVGDQLWLAFGKELRVLRPTLVDDDPSVELFHHRLPQTNVGDITAATIIPGLSQWVYLGHSDGKITKYSRESHTCKQLATVGLSKINCLVGVGSHLWAGFSSGMIYVYDVSTTPWIVKKDWRSHTNPVVSMVADVSSIWKINRMQVLSLGAENSIGIWDGMLEDDWLENDMHKHDHEFCTFRGSSALVVTWNAAARKPADLERDQVNCDFFEELFEGACPDVVVFGLQELVDLEDKKLTAKSFFKSKRSDEYGQELLSRAYREWRDYLVDCIGKYAVHDYALIHTASLIGLFTCVFVRESERSKVREIQSAEVKTGFGGLHGNKGALLVRFTLDDTSICSVNCHLAAGHGSIAHRNSDVATILENPHLPRRQLPVAQTEVFVGGGDGSMVLDHEICFMHGDLNYRIEGIPRAAVMHALQSKDLPQLLEHDQLSLQIHKNPMFRLRAFEEPAIHFEPTYKYDIGKDTYDSSEKQRIPAWCDRILYRGLDKVVSETYQRHEVRASDHRPLSARYQLRVKSIKADRRLECWKASQKRYEQVKEEVATLSKLGYLQSIYTLSPEEARKML